MRVAYLDCIGGISGDMTLAALIDAGADVDQLRAGLRTLGLPGWELEVNRTQKSGIAAASVEVVVNGADAGDAPLLRVPPNDAPLEGGHSHAHEHSHGGHEHSHETTHSHEHRHVHVSTHTHTHEASHTHDHTHAEPGHTHGAEQAHSHEHADHGHKHEHGHEHTHTHDDAHDHTRGFNDVAALIRNSGLPEVVKERAEAVYRRLAHAEATVHGATLESVHFHEVGAVDSIIDVVGAVYALHLLGVERVLCSALPNGHGFVRCAHGLMPIPPPATAELLQGVPLRQVDVQGELVTPTGAALASTLAESFGPLPGLTIQATGYGAGKKNFPFPNLLRVLICEDATAPAEATTVTLIEANIDDQSPQLYESVMEALFHAGALDVWTTPIQMKKNRPAQTLHVLCDPATREAVASVLFRETTTLGVRYSTWERECLQREWLEVPTRYGAVRVKVGRQGGAFRTAAPEYEDCRRAAAEVGVPVKLVQAAAIAAAYEQLGDEVK